MDSGEIQKKIAETLDKLTNKGKSSSVKFRKQKRAERKEKALEEQIEADKAKSTLQVTEFVSVGELASMMDVNPNEIISSCMMLGIMVTMNQRLDAETLTIVAEEFGFGVEFVSAEVQEAIDDEEDNEEDLSSRSPIVTIMGHVDHGKTSLLDYIRKENVIAGEAGGITQHIGAYEVTLSDERKITFIDTPGHEAFTAMRARGAQVTDLAIIVIAVDDNVMPQTKEAISHAQAAEVPIVFAFNKIDKPNTNSDSLKEQLSTMNLLVEDWGGKYQSQDISAKTGKGIDELLDKVILESDILELKANSKRKAQGTIIEASLDKGKGYVATILVQNGSLKKGDFILAGRYTGKIKAMYDERGKGVDKVGPSKPITILGLNGAPQAGDTFNVMDEEKEAKQIATKRNQLQREQSIRTQKHITLDEIGRRLAIGDFKELNIIVKGDVDGSIEALTDSLLKLSTDQIQVNIIHKGVGQITDSDVLLASASNAVILGFQVRPSLSARKLADKEHIDIRIYSIIYDAINAIKDALEGMHEPEMKEEIIGNAEVRNTFKIPKAGTIAGCYILDGKIVRNSQARLIRDGIVIYTGKLNSLKRFKDDAKEVQKGYECGMGIENFNDIKVGDIIESFTQVEA
ncbi:MAG: translation initiation factor IF-2 [Flavobacteriales bacterium TMED113]|nr:MAG: translation initiation factor IF-2 [Flavobacteriales bacterium TMED113]